MENLAIQNLESVKYLKNCFISTSITEFASATEEQDVKKTERFHKESYKNLIALKLLIGEEDNIRAYYTFKYLSRNAKEISDIVEGEKVIERWSRLSVEHVLSAKESYNKINEPKYSIKKDYAFFTGFAANILESYVIKSYDFFKGTLENGKESLLALSVDFDIECAELTKELNYKHSSICFVNAGRKAMYLFTLTGKESYRKSALSYLRTFTNRYEDEREALKKQDVFIHRSDLLLLKHKPLYELLKRNIKLMVNGDIKKGTEIEYFISKNKNRRY